MRNFVATCIEDGFGYQLEAGQEQDTVVWSLVLEDVGEEDTGLYRCQVSAELLRDPLTFSATGYKYNMTQP